MSNSVSVKEVRAIRYVDPVEHQRQADRARRQSEFKRALRCLPAADRQQAFDTAMAEIAAEERREKLAKKMQELVDDVDDEDLGRLEQEVERLMQSFSLAGATSHD